MRLLSKTLLAVALAVGLPMAAHAESTFTTGVTTPITATARVDFQVTVPKILYLRVGAGSNFASNPTINLIDFAVPAASIGSGTPIAATLASGDLGNGSVTARVIGNNGNVTLSSTTLGALGNGSGDTISYGQISTAAAVLTSVAALPAPALADAATTNTTVTAVAKIVNRDAQWTYSYLNGAVVAPGTYGGVNTQNGRVTYTASMP